MARLRTRQKFDKYRIEGRLGEGGFATVYQAMDTIEGVRVALKIPTARALEDGGLKAVLREVRIVARLEHPNILPLKTAGHVDGVFAIVQPLGDETLAGRLRRRLSAQTALGFADQVLAAVAHAHEQGIVHLDIKPENIILFGDRVRLADFGIAKVALETRTVTAAGTGTIGFMAPEQAYGKPSKRSDVFAIGLVIYRMLAGSLPEWPYDWPPEGFARLRERANPAIVEVLRRAISLDQSKRYKDAGVMLAAWKRARRAPVTGKTRRKRKAHTDTQRWRDIRLKDFRRRFGVALATRYDCRSCGNPVSHEMLTCPWCGKEQKKFRLEPSFPTSCPRCGRGAKLDWKFCAWCYGGAIQEPDTRSYPDRRYESKCKSCSGDLMPFSRYCPWCRHRVQRTWKLPGTRDKCRSCGNGITREFWTWCPWCGKRTGS